MGDQDDIEQARFMAFIAQKAGTTRWHIWGDTRITSYSGQSKAITRKQFERWRREYEEKFNVTA